MDMVEVSAATAKENEKQDGKEIAPDHLLKDAGKGNECQSLFSGRINSKGKYCRENGYTGKDGNKGVGQ